MLFLLAAAIFKSLLLKMAASIRTTEFATIHHLSGQKLTEHYVNYNILVYDNNALNKNMNKG